jgi:hypothetical protein
MPRRPLAMLARTAATLACVAAVARAQATPASRPKLPVGEDAYVAPTLAVEPVLLEVRIGQAASLALAGERAGERAWLPVASLLEAMEVEVAQRTARRVVAVRWPEGTRLVLDADSTLVRVGARVVPLPPRALLVRDGELLADVQLVAALLGVPAELGFGDMVLSFPVVDALPIGRRLAREAARARFRTTGERAGDDGDVAPLARPWADGAVLDYGVALPIGARIARPGWNAALGLDVLGGSFEVTGGATAAGTTLPTLASWTGVWSRGAKLTQLRIGDGTGAGPRPRLGRGVMLTNAPWVRPALFGLQTVRGALPPGWAIEAYRNGELVAIDTVGRGAAFQLQLPLLYGENPVDLLAVGPFGQTRALSQATRVGFDLLPAGRSEYALGAARCQLRQQCTTTASADWRVGLSSRWTARGGVEALARDSSGWRASPYVALSGTPTGAIGVQGELAARSHARLAMNVEPSQRLRFTAEQQWFARDPLDPLLAGRRTMQTSAFATWRSFSPAQPVLEASIDRSAFPGGTALVRARLSAGAQSALVRAQGYVRADQPARGAPIATLVGTEVQLLPDARRGRWFGASLWRLLGEVDDRGRASRAALTGAMPMPGAFRVDAGVAWQRGVRGLLATLTVARDLDVLRSYTTATAGRDASSATQSLQGSMLLARREGRPVLVPGPSLQRAGVAGVVFLDRDADGVRDADEPVVPGVRVQVGAGHATADSSGRYRVWDLVPYVPVDVSVDSTTLPSPLWIPALASPRIEIGPNRFEPLDVPLVPGGVVEGRVLDDARGAGEVPVELLDARGRVLARVTTFSDGEFLAMGVRPGTVTARVAASWLRAQDAASEAVTTTLPAGDDGATVRVADLVVRRQRVPIAPLVAPSVTGATDTVSSPSSERSSTVSVREPVVVPTVASSASRTRTSRVVQPAPASRARSAAVRRAAPSKTSSRAAPQPRTRTRSVQPAPSRKAATSPSARGAGRTRAETRIAPCCAPSARGAPAPQARSAPRTTPKARGPRTRRGATTEGRDMRGDIGSTDAVREQTDAARRASHRGQGAGRTRRIAQVVTAQRRGCEDDGLPIAAPPRASLAIVAPVPRATAY